MKTKIDDLRNHLFETIEMIKDGDERMSLDKAKRINEISQTIINTAKVEVEFIEATGAITGTGFMPEKMLTHLPGKE